MKLNYHKNLEHHLVKNGFQVKFKTEEFIPKTHLVLRKFDIHILHEEKFIRIYYTYDYNRIEIEGCKTLNDLYRLEKLIEGTTNENQNQ
jgi:hypothetical protein